MCTGAKYEKGETDIFVLKVWAIQCRSTLLYMLILHTYTYNNNDINLIIREWFI